jgi:hypothetical protein
MKYIYGAHLASSHLELSHEPVDDGELLPHPPGVQPIMNISNTTASNMYNFFIVISFHTSIKNKSLKS